ncbi:atherin-like [Melozone crissalis]|uniref:atherin-like n=1 Tax=Melozone crissalis TaxID=40204 RepID=UPI0023DC3D44|nr:atherin-like [Melozone crissalis]
MAVPPPPPPGPEQAPRYQEWILDTIDSLRSRKARPDLERICRMVRRRHGPEPERTRAELEKLIQQRAVLRVSYKGSISYRNAARVQPPRRPPPPARRPPPVSLRDTARLLGGDGRLTRGRLQGSAARPPSAPPQAKACAPGEGGCQHMAPLKKEGAFGQPDRCPQRWPGAEPSVPLSPGRPGPQAAEGAPFSCTPGRKDKAVDPVEWSVRDVVEYFTEAGFPEQAGAFQEQEIDGKSLLLMQRADVLTGLSIRLGPALKIYEYHVKLLQRSHFQDEEPPPEPFPA